MSTANALSISTVTSIKERTYIIVSAEAQPVHPDTSGFLDSVSVETQVERRIENPLRRDPKKKKQDEAPAEEQAKPPVEKPAEKPAEKSAAKPAEKSAAKPAEKSAAKPAEKAPEKPAVKPAEKAPEKAPAAAKRSEKNAGEVK